VTPHTQYGVETPVVKRLRADAQRNRDRLLQAAELVFAERGLDAATEDIARAAGVGIGTLFRHFPTKEALLEAVFVARLHQLAIEAQALEAAPDAGAAFETFFCHVIDHSRSKLALADALVAAGINLDRTAAAAKAELTAALGRLLERAQHAGAIRPDLSLPELLALIVGASRAAQHLAADPPRAQRTIRVILDGLAPGRSGPHLIPPQPPLLLIGEGGVLPDDPAP